MAVNVVVLMAELKHGGRKMIVGFSLGPEPCCLSQSSCTVACLGFPLKFAKFLFGERISTHKCTSTTLCLRVGSAACLSEKTRGSIVSAEIQPDGGSHGKAFLGSRVFVRKQLFFSGLHHGGGCGLGNKASWMFPYRARDVHPFSLAIFTTHTGGSVVIFLRF